MTISVSANNGQAPASALATMPGRNGDGSSQTSPVNVAASYGRLRQGMQAAGLGDLLPSNGWSCYRDRAAQQHMRNIGLTTIPVGQSIHGEWSLGGAVDFSNLGGFGAPRHNWLRSNGAAFGWYQPGWAQQNGSLPEPWHWEYDQRNDPRAGEDDDMTPEQAQSLAEIQRMITLQILTPSGHGSPGTDAESIYVQSVNGVIENAAEARRGTGVTNGALPPAGAEQSIPAQVSTGVRASGHEYDHDGGDHSPLVLGIVAIVIALGGCAVAIADALGH